MYCYFKSDVALVYWNYLEEVVGMIYEIDKVDIGTIGYLEGVSKDWYLSSSSTAYIKWSLDIHHRRWGIDGMTPDIPEQTIGLIYMEPTDDDEIEHFVEYTIKNWEFEFESFETITSLMIIPIRIEINFKKNVSTLVFQIS